MPNRRQYNSYTDFMISNEFLADLVEEKTYEVLQGNVPYLRKALENRYDDSYLFLLFRNPERGIQRDKPFVFFTYESLLSIFANDTSFLRAIVEKIHSIRFSDLKPYLSHPEY